MSYKIQEKPDPTATLDNGEELQPLVTLKDEYGGISHIIEDDHCYVLVNDVRGDGLCRMVSHWYKEAVDALKTLPPFNESNLQEETSSSKPTNFSKNSSKHIEEISWKEFKDSGFLWFVNRILHVFGIVLIFGVEVNSNAVRVFPARTTLRGFPYEAEGRGYKNLAKYMHGNSGFIMKAFPYEQEETISNDNN